VKDATPKPNLGINPTNTHKNHNLVHTKQDSINLKFVKKKLFYNKNLTNFKIIE
jgi:hypothetical protein